MEFKKIELTMKKNTSHFWRLRCSWLVSGLEKNGLNKERR